MNGQNNTENFRNNQDQTTKDVDSGLAQNSPGGDDVQIEGGDAGKYDDGTETDMSKDGNDVKENDSAVDHELPSESTESEFAHVTAAPNNDDEDEEKLNK
jgi:hypothetical protein